MVAYPIIPPVDAAGNDSGGHAVMVLSHACAGETSGLYAGFAGKFAVGAGLLKASCITTRCLNWVLCRFKSLGPYPNFSWASRRAVWQSTLALLLVCLNKFKFVEHMDTHTQSFSTISRRGFFQVLWVWVLSIYCLGQCCPTSLVRACKTALCFFPRATTQLFFFC